jgi:hypothetical protein
VYHTDHFTARDNDYHGVVLNNFHYPGQPLIL